MATDNHTPVVVTDTNHPDSVNDPLSELDEAIGDRSALSTNPASLVLAIEEYAYGGANISQKLLKAWTEAGAYELNGISYDTTYEFVVSIANVRWPDGSGGTFITTGIDSDVEAINSYTITHNGSGKTVTQPVMTRNSEGQVTTKPYLTVT